MTIKYFLLIIAVIPFAFSKCKQENKPIPYNDAIQRCTMKIVNDTLYFNSNCLDGAQIPEFTAVDIQGTQITDKTIRGKLILLNFWFIECPPCIDEMPTLHKIDSLFNKKDFEIISICRNNKADVAEFLDKNNVPYKVVPDGKFLLQDIFKHPFGYPSNILIDKKGKIINVYRALIEENKKTEYEEFVNEVKKRL